MSEVNNYFKTENEEERIKIIYIKMANMVCQSESDDRIKYTIDIEKLPNLCYTDKKAAEFRNNSERE